MRRTSEKLEKLYQSREKEALIRVKRIVAWREQGIGFTEIGKLLKITRQRIYQIRERFKIQ